MQTASEPSGSTSKARPGLYLTQVMAALILPLLAIAGLNLYVDPFLYFWPRAASAPEPAFSVFDREVHYNLVAHAHPRSLLLGNSQTQHGLVPSHWRAPAPVINAAAVGAGMIEMQRTLQLAQGQGHVEEALLGIDFGMTRRWASDAPKVNDMYLLSPDGRLRPELLKGIVSFPMLRASLSMLSLQRHHTRYYGAQGEALDSLYEASLALHGGAMGALRGRLSEFRKSMSQRRGDFKADLRAMRDTACAGGTRLQVYMTPLHAIWLQTQEELGLEPEWEQWKRDVVAISTERPECRFEVWDFNTYNSITTEATPPARGALRGSWDGVHYRTATGDKILARIAAGPAAQPLDDFGLALTPANIDQVIHEDRLASAQYRLSHVGQAVRLGLTTSAVGEHRPGASARPAKTDLEAN